MAATFLHVPLKYCSDELTKNLELLQFIKSKYHILYLEDQNLENRSQYLLGMQDIQSHIDKLIKQPKQLQIEF